MDTINLFFNPKNVVLFGASDKPGSVGETTLKNLLLLISPFTPHLAEEMWSMLGEKEFISLEKWPKYDEKKIPKYSVIELDLIKNDSDFRPESYRPKQGIDEDIKGSGV